VSSLSAPALPASLAPKRESRDNPLLRSALGGARMEKASGAFAKEAPRLLVALRRAVPFLSRRRVPIRVASVKPCSLTDLVASLARPAFVQPLTVRGAGVGGRGALVLDAHASALFLDGVLGGDGTGLPELPPNGLTAPQSALVAGITSNIVRTFAEALEAAFAVRVTPAREEGDDPAADRASIACVIEIGDPMGEAPCAQIIVSLPKEVLGSSQADLEAAVIKTDARVAQVLETVELDVVAELGRVRLRVADFVRLKVGDTLKLDVQVNGDVTVRAETKEIFRGRPTTSGGQIALAIREVVRHER
jgi:flagellar motor switch protein FliM